MAKTQCKAAYDNEQCIRGNHAKGYCGLHVTQWKRHGRIVSLHPDPMRASAHKPAIERFAERIKVGGINGHCWEWRGAKDKDGYASFSDGGKKWRGHRWAWVHIAGRTLERGAELDHICSNPSCVRPSHIQMLKTRQHHKISAQRKAMLKAHRHEEFAIVAGNPKPLSVREGTFAIANNLPRNFFGTGFIAVALHTENE